MTWQLYWKNWWKLWPYYRAEWDMSTNEGFNDYEMRLHVFAFGPLQIRWYSLT